MYDIEELSESADSLSVIPAQDEAEDELIEAFEKMNGGNVNIFAEERKLMQQSRL